MLVTDVMTWNVATCRIGDTLNQAVQLMWDERCGAVAVLDNGQRVVGIVTDRDACMAAYTQGARFSDIPVSTAMSEAVVACLPSASIEEAENLMMAHDIRRLAVITPDERLLGLVSLDDIAAIGARNGKNGLDIRRIAMALGEIVRNTGCRPTSTSELTSR